MKANKKFEPATVERVIESFSCPAFVVTEHGCVVVANAAARRIFPRPPLWLVAATRPQCAQALQPLCSIRRISAAGIPLWLVRPDQEATRALSSAGGQAILAGLPHSLAPVAELLLCGLSDRKIALCTDLSLASVRTYIVRLFRRLGLSSRKDLIRAAFADRTSAAPGHHQHHGSATADQRELRWAKAGRGHLR